VIRGGGEHGVAARAVGAQSAQAARGAAGVRPDVGHAVMALSQRVLDFVLNDRLDDLLRETHFFRFVQHLLRLSGEFLFDLMFESGERGFADDGRGQRLLGNSLPRVLVG